MNPGSRWLGRWFLRLCGRASRKFEAYVDVVERSVRVKPASALEAGEVARVLEARRADGVDFVPGTLVLGGSYYYVICLEPGPHYLQWVVPRGFNEDDFPVEVVGVLAFDSGVPCRVPTGRRRIKL